MSDLQRRIATIKGWTNLSVNKQGLLVGYLSNQYRELVPAWHKDLKLAWNLEEELNEVERFDYPGKLNALVWPENAGHCPEYVTELGDLGLFYLAHATAAQRCEAWVKIKQ